jgi:hypothetical protein
LLGSNGEKRNLSLIKYLRHEAGPIASGSEDDDLRCYCRITDIAGIILDPETKGGRVRSIAARLQFERIGKGKDYITRKKSGLGNVRRDLVQLRIQEITVSASGRSLLYEEKGFVDISLQIRESQHDLQITIGWHSGGTHTFQGKLRSRLERIFVAGCQQDRTDNEGQKTPHGAFV